MRGRAPIGAGQAVGAAGATNHALAQASGEETHVLVNGEMPVHGHGYVTHGQSTNHWHADAGHNHTPSVGNNQFLSDGPGTGANVTTGGGNYVKAYGTSTNSAVIGPADRDHTHAIDGDGGGAAHNNMQPFLALNAIIAAL
jgi:microcystin-dependent protein